MKIQGIKCPGIDNAGITFEKRYLDDEFVRDVEITFHCDDGFLSTTVNNFRRCTNEGWSEDIMCLKSK